MRSSVGRWDLKRVDQLLESALSRLLGLAFLFGLASFSFGFAFRGIPMYPGKAHRMGLEVPREIREAEYALWTPRSKVKWRVVSPPIWHLGYVLWRLFLLLSVLMLIIVPFKAHTEWLLRRRKKRVANNDGAQESPEVKCSEDAEAE